VADLRGGTSAGLTMGVTFPRAEGEWRQNALLTERESPHGRRFAGIPESSSMMPSAGLLGKRSKKQFAPLISW